jgi:hypothetical protein
MIHRGDGMVFWNDVYAVFLRIIGYAPGNGSLNSQSTGIAWGWCDASRARARRSRGGLKDDLPI